MKCKSLILLAGVLLGLPYDAATAQTGIVSDKTPDFALGNMVCVGANGRAFMKSDSIAQKDADMVESTVYYSPYTPKSAVHNDKDAPVRVSMKKEGKGDSEKTKWYLEIPDSIMGRMFTAITRFSQTPARFQYTHQEIAEGMYSFVLSPDKKNVLLKDCSDYIDVDTLDAIAKAVDISNSYPIVATMKVDTCENGVYKVEANSILLNDNFMALHKDIIAGYQLSQMDPSRSVVNSVHAYPLNIEINTTRTYPTQSQRFSNGFITVGLNTSLILLPKTPMQRRLADPRMGVLSLTTTHFSDIQQKVEKKELVTRWRLEPKNAEDAQRQKNGELIEPKKPIVYYIDPAFAKKWIPYVKEGVAEWQRCFERAGWKNAIYATEWPTNDSTFADISMEDARYNIIRLVPTDTRMVYGSNRAWDYRSGEFLNSFILFFQGAFQQLRDSYVGNCGAVDPECHTAVFPDSLMGALIRHAIAKNIAPTIGLVNNLYSSHLTPTDSLRSKSYIRKYGMAPSITDNLPYNFVAQPGDGLTREELIPRVGDGDDWTVMLAYKDFGYDDPEQERQYLTQMLTDSLEANPRFQFGTDLGNDPFCKGDDLGDDQVKAVEYGLKNIKLIAPEITNWGETTKDFTYSNLNKQAYWAAINGEVLRMYVILANNFTGVCQRIVPAGVKGSTFSYTSREHVQRCLDMLFRMFGEQATWVLPEGSDKYTWGLPERAGLGYAGHITSLASSSYLNYVNPNMNWLDWLQQIYDVCFKQSAPGQAPDLYNRLLQNLLTSVFAHNLNYVSPFSRYPNIGKQERTYSLYFLKKVQKRVKAALAAAPDDTTRAHYTMLLTIADEALDIK